MGKVNNMAGMWISVALMAFLAIVVNVIGDDAREAMKIAIENDTHPIIGYVYMFSLLGWVLSVIGVFTFMVRIAMYD